MEIEQLRELRKKEVMDLPLNPFIRDHLDLGDGKSVPLVIRNYQKIGIANILVCPKTIASDATGLGKTLQVLSAVSYLWMREPDYVPIVLTTKSAVFQWAAECEKFLVGIEPIVVHGDPYKRNLAYEEFFLGESDKKRVLLLTYDTLFRDIEPSIIRDKSVKVSKDTKEKYKLARETEAVCKSRVEELLFALKEITDGRRFEDSEYVFARLNGRQEKQPPGWSSHDENMVNAVLMARQDLRVAAKAAAELKAEVSPSTQNLGIMHYLKDMKAQNPNVKFIMAMDEAHKVKNHKSQVHEKVKLVGDLCDRVIAMTATPVKNRLMEFFGIFHIVEPRLFPKITAFQNEYCVMKMQRIGGGRQVPVVVGYKNLDKFVEKIEPFYLARQKHEVAKELPELISMEIECELSDEQEMLYDMAESSDELGDEENPGAALAALTMCQQAANAPQLILNDEGNPFTGKSSKIDTLLDLLEENEDQKVIIFSRFEKMISLVGDVLKENKIKYVRITGKENNAKYRQEAKETFQDANSGVNVIMITLAGAESLNLQAAEHFVFLDMPWSYGDLDQLIGRMIRIGSSHKTVSAHFFLSRRISGDKTIDHHVLAALKAKQKLVKTVTGNTANPLNLQTSNTDMTRDILTLMRNAASGAKTETKKTKPKAAKSGKANTPATGVESKKPEEPKLEIQDIDFSGI